MRQARPAEIPLSFTVEPGDVPVFVVRGAVVAASAPPLSAAICACRGNRVVVDLRAAAPVDPAALPDVVLAARLLGVDVRVVGL